MQDDDGACPACGAPDGTCSGGHELPRTPLLAEWAEGGAVERPSMRVRNPIGPSHPVFVHEAVYETQPIANSKRTRNILRFVVGDRITLEQAERYGIPMLDENRQPVAGAKPQKPKPEVETQEVRGPRVREPKVDRTRPRPRRAPRTKEAEGDEPA